VNPVAADNPGLFSSTEMDSWLETESRLFAAVEKLKQSTDQLRKLGF